MRKACRCGSTTRRPIVHLKFALFDASVLVKGSFNWIRDATRDNDENLVVSNDTNLVRVFGLQFEKLWDKFG